MLIFIFENYLLTYLLSDSLTHSLTPLSPYREYNRFSARPEIPCISWNLKVYYCIHKCLPPIPILSHIDPVHTPTFHFLFFHFVTVNEFQFLWQCCITSLIFSKNQKISFSNYSLVCLWNKIFLWNIKLCIDEK